MRNVAGITLVVLAGCVPRAGISAGQTAPLTAFAAPPVVSTGPNAACAPFGAAQKSEALATYGKKPPQLTKDTGDVDTLADAYGHGLDASPDVAMAQLLQYPVDVRVLERVERKYGAFMCAEREAIDGPGEMERELKAATQAMQAFRGDIERRAGTARNELSEKLGSAESLMKGYRAKSVSVDAKKRSLLGDSASDVRESLRGAEVVLRALEITRGPDAADTVRARAEVEATRATLNRMNDEIATVNLPIAPAPNEAYFGGDRAAIKAAVKADWKTRYPAETVVGVYLTGTKWTHKSGSYFRDRDSRIVQFDNSFLPVTVAVKSSDKSADVFTYDIRKDHLEANALKTDYAATREKTSKVLLKRLH